MHHSAIRRTLLATVLLTAGLASSLPAAADPPPWAPAHGRRAKERAPEVREVHIVHDYQYVYYPARQVYYAPESGNWFWASGGNWQVNVSLPTRMQAAIGVGVPVVLHSERPYAEHRYVEENIGRPWREKHGHEHKHGH